MRAGKDLAASPARRGPSVTTAPTCAPAKAGAQGPAAAPLRPGLLPAQEHGCHFARIGFTLIDLSRTDAKSRTILRPPSSPSPCQREMPRQRRTASHFSVRPERSRRAVPGLSGADIPSGTRARRNSRWSKVMAACPAHGSSADRRAIVRPLGLTGAPGARAPLTVMPALIAPSTARLRPVTVAQRSKESPGPCSRRPCP